MSMATVLDIGNRNLVGTRIIDTGHTATDPGNFYQGWWLFSREITGENRVSVRRKRWRVSEWEKEKKREREEKEALNRVGETRYDPPEEDEEKVFRTIARFLPDIDYGNRACSCFLESRKISRVHAESTDHEVEPIRQTVEYRRRVLTRVSWIRREMASRCHSAS